MAERLNGVPVVKGADRYEAGMFALEHLGPFGKPGEKAALPLFILDDGFQHRRLQRDKDILLVDAQNPFDNRKLLPVGLLREPLGEMKRAGIIVITKGRGSEVTSLKNEITSLSPHASVFVSGHVPAYVKARGGELHPTEWLSGKGVYAFCGIADPDCFRLGLSGLGAQVMGFKAYRDHYWFRQDDVDYIERAAGESGAGWMITTEKDMMRLRPLRLPENLLALGIEVEVEDGFYEEAFDLGVQK
jgi:tetraacyldisaccharide 4'-kinase